MVARLATVLAADSRSTMRSPNPLNREVGDSVVIPAIEPASVPHRSDLAPPRVSFIVTCYNYSRFVCQAIDSLLNQTFESIEVIVVDDASTDGSWEILQKYAADPRVTLIHHVTNRGHMRSRQEGFDAARGEFVAAFDADDFAVRPDAVARQIAVFDADSAVGFVFAPMTIVDENGVVISAPEVKKQDYIRAGLDEFRGLILDNYVPHSGTLARRSCERQIGGYDPDLPHAADWDLWLRLSARFKVGFVGESLYAYRIHTTNMHHASYSPHHANSEALRTLEKAFDALPSGAPSSLRDMRQAAYRRVLLKQVWYERHYGRTRRSWIALLDGARRAPGLLMTPRFYWSLVRNLLLTTLGTKRYKALASRGVN
jgi:glycosyltransferase involved in cell wall biosynthesis